MENEKQLILESLKGHVELQMQGKSQPLLQVYSMTHLSASAIWGLVMQLSGNEEQSQRILNALHEDWRYDAPLIRIWNSQQMYAEMLTNSMMVFDPQPYVNSALGLLEWSLGNLDHSKQIYTQLGGNLPMNEFGFIGQRFGGIDEYAHVDFGGTDFPISATALFTLLESAVGERDIAQKRAESLQTRMLHQKPTDRTQLCSYLAAVCCDTLLDGSHADMLVNRHAVDAMHGAILHKGIPDYQLLTAYGLMLVVDELKEKLGSG